MVWRKLWAPVRLLADRAREFSGLGSLNSLSRFAAFQLAMAMRMSGRVFEFEVGAFAAARRRKMFSLYAGHFECSLAVVMNDCIDAGRLDDFAGLERVISCHLKLRE